MESAQIERRDHACRPVLCLHGEIDLVVREPLRSALRQLVLDAHSPAYVDMSDVTFFDSTGVHALVDAQQLAAEHGVDLVVTPSRPVSVTLDLLGLTEQFRRGSPPDPLAAG